MIGGRNNLNKAGSLFGTVAVYRSIIVSIFLIVISIGVLIFANIYHHNWDTTEALVIQGPDCKDSWNNKGNKTQKCSYQLEITVNGITRQTSLNNVDFQSPIIRNGDWNNKYIEVEYNKNNIADVGVPFKNIKSTLNWIFGVILFFSIINLFITYKYRNNKILKGVKAIGLAQNIITPNRITPNRRNNNRYGFFDVLFK